MKTIVRQTNAALWIQPDGNYTAAQPFERGAAGAGDVTLPVAGDRTPFFGQDAFGNAIPLGAERSAPGSLATTTLENYLGFYRDLLEKMGTNNLTRNIQIRWHDCISLDNPAGWTKTLILGHAESGDMTITAPLSREYADGRVVKNTPVNAVYWIMLVRQALSRLTTTEPEGLSSVAFLSDLSGSCGTGYAGPDKIGYITADAALASTANVLYTTNGGSTFAATSADPFVADEDVDFATTFFINKNQFRLIVGRTTTDAAAAAEVAYADVTLGSEGTTTWTAVDVGSTLGDVIEAIHFSSFSRIYAATAGDIYVSTDQGASWTQVYVGSTAISEIATAPNGNVYAVGATGTILVESGQNGIFSALTAPGASDISSIAISNDGSLWIGYGTSIQYSQSSTPASSGSWTQSKDFGTNKAVIKISAKGGEKALGGDSQVVQVVVTDSVAAAGTVWMTLDGGGFWEQVTNLTNSGYTHAYFSPVDQNLAYIVGPIDSATGLIQLLSPEQGV